MRRFSLSALFAIVFLVPFTAMAQSQSPPPPAADQQLLKAEELDALVAPIALYPDPLLAQVLMASSYPLEVVQADRWVSENKKLKGDSLKAVVDKEKWDDSIKALVATPSVLAMMSSKLDWTQKLGDAVLAQQADVMDAIQRLRAKAQANNKLSSTKEQKVTVTREQSKQYIAIEPTNPETVYVPYYDPNVVYGGWPYPAYPPYYFGYPGYVPGALLATGIAFGAGYAIGRWGSGGNYWGGSFNWNNNNININRPRVNPLGGNNWQHNPAHRQGVRYNNPRVQQRFGNNNLRNGAQGRMDFRGRNGQQVVRPGGGAGAATRPAEAAATVSPPAPPEAEIVRRLGPPAVVEIVRRRGPQAAQGAATLWAIFNPDDRRTCNRSEVVQAWAVAAVAQCAVAAVAQCAGAAEVEAVAAVVEVVAAAAGGRICGSSTTSRFSAGSTMASASIALPTMAATKPTSA